MNKALIFKTSLTILLCVSAPASAQTQPKAPDCTISPPGPTVSVTTKDAVVTFIGTIHLSNAAARLAVERWMNVCGLSYQALAVEVDPESESARLGADKTTSISPAHIELLSAINETAVEIFRDQQFLDPAPLDDFYAQFARNKIPIISLESAQEQLEALLKINESDARELAKEMRYRNQTGAPRAQMLELWRRWEAGDYEAFRLSIKSDCLRTREMQQLCAVLKDSRDRVMAQRIHELFKKYSKILVVIGVGHVDGILKYLGELRALTHQ